MKRILFTAAGLLALIALPALAQESAYKPRVGGVLGLNMSKISIKDLPSGIDNKFRIGLTIGGVADVVLSDKVSLDTGLLLRMKGGKQEYTISEFGFTATGKTTSKLTYLCIPIAARVAIPAGEMQIKPFVKFGPEVGILLSAKESSEGSLGKTAGLAQTTDSDIKEYVKTLDLGVLAAVGAEYPMENLVMFGEVGYTHGLLNVGKNRGTDKVNEKNRSLSLSVGVKLPL